jgi:integrase
MQRKKSPALGQISAHVEALHAAHGPDTNYRQALAQLSEIAGHLEPRQLNPLMAFGLVAGWRHRNAPSTAYHRRNALQRILRHLEKFGAPPIDLPKLRMPKARGITATREEIAQLLTHASPHMRLFILLCWHLALRFSEAFAVSTQAWDRDNHTITVTVKGGGERTIPTTPEVEEMLAVATHHEAPGQGAVSALHGHRSYSKYALRMEWKRLKKKAGLRGHEANPHDLRRTTATALYAISKDLRAVQQYLGHTTMAATVHYIAPLAPDKLREYQQLLDFEHFHSAQKQ